MLCFLKELLKLTLRRKLLRTERSHSGEKMDKYEFAHKYFNFGGIVVN